MSLIRPLAAAFLSVASATLLIAAPAAAQISNNPFPEPIPDAEGVIVVGLEEFATLPS